MGRFQPFLWCEMCSLFHLLDLTYQFPSLFRPFASDSRHHMIQRIEITTQYPIQQFSPFIVKNV